MLLVQLHQCYLASNVPQQMYPRRHVALALDDYSVMLTITFFPELAEGNGKIAYIIQVLIQKKTHTR